MKITIKTRDLIISVDNLKEDLTLTEARELVDMALVAVGYDANQVREQ